MAKKKKGLSKQQVGYIIAGFGIFLLGGVVYAATTGILSISGTVTRGDAVDLDFINASCATQVTTGVETGDGYTVAGAAGGDYNCGVTIADVTPATANGAKDKLNFGVYLREPGDTNTITFYIKNVGSVPALLDSIAVSTTGFVGDATDNGISLSGTYSNLATGQTLAVGGMAGPYTIVIDWPIAATDATGGASFTATLDYEQGT